MSALLRQPRWRSSIFNFGQRVNGTRVFIAGGQESEVVRLQRVKFRRKGLVRRSIVAGVGLYCAYEIYTTVVWSPVERLLDKLDQEYASLSEKERKKLEEEAAAAKPLFFPLPLTTSEVEPQPYKGSDPEWQEFIKFSRNPGMNRAVQRALAEIAKSLVETHPSLSRTCGEDIRIQKTWFNFDYPYKPPPTFTRMGLEWSDDGLSLATREVDAQTVFKMRRILNPTALSQSMWAFHTALVKQNAAALAKIFGYEPKPQSSMNDTQQALDKVRQQINKTQQPKTDAKNPLPPSTKTEAADGSTTDPTSPVDKRSTDISTPGPPPQSSGASSSSIGPSGPSPSKRELSAKDIYGIQEMTEHTSGPWQAFKKKFAQTWRPSAMPAKYPPRGSIHVVGTVELRGRKGKVVVEVFAWFDPKRKTLDASTLKLYPKHISPHQLQPLGR